MVKLAVRLSSVFSFNSKDLGRIPFYRYAAVQSFVSCIASVIFQHLKSIERQKDAVIWILVLRTGLLRMLSLRTEFCKFRIIFACSNEYITDYRFVFYFCAIYISCHGLWPAADV